MWDLAKKFLRLKTTSVEERRREVREVLTRGNVVIDGRKYPLNNWSPSGFGFGPTALSPNIGTRMAIEFHVPLADRDLIFSTPCLIVRVVESEGIVGGIFLDVDPETRATIDAHFDVLTDDSLRQEVEDRFQETKERFTC